MQAWACSDEQEALFSAWYSQIAWQAISAERLRAT
jgi:hypothetical protein